MVASPETTVSLENVNNLGGTAGKRAGIAGTARKTVGSLIVSTSTPRTRSEPTGHNRVLIDSRTEHQRPLDASGVVGAGFDEML